MNSKYEQGWRQARVQLKSGRRWRLVKTVAAIVLAIVFAGAMVVGLAGCATQPIAVKAPVVQVADHQTISGLVRVAQMGADCSSEQEALKRVLADVFVGQGLPRPSIVDVRPLAGSSYCGFAQGMADPIGTPELGARNTAVAEVTAYWSAIGYTDLRKAQAVLTAMRPLRK